MKKIHFICASLLCLLCSRSACEENISEAPREEFNVIEQKMEIHAKHILISDEAKASEIIADIKSKKITFEDAAKKHSICPSSESGGDLGYFRKGMMVKEFEDAVFGAKDGDVIGPVKTDFGYHVIMVVGRRGDS